MKFEHKQKKKTKIKTNKSIAGHYKEDIKLKFQGIESMFLEVIKNKNNMQEF